MGGGRGGSEWNLVGPSTSCAEEDCGGYHDVAGLTKRAVGGWPASVPIVFLPFESGFSVHAGGALASEAISEEVSRGAHLHSRTQARKRCTLALRHCIRSSSCSCDAASLDHARRLTPARQATPTFAGSPAAAARCQVGATSMAEARGICKRFYTLSEVSTQPRHPMDLLCLYSCCLSSVPHS